MKKKALSLFMAAVMIATTPASTALGSESGTTQTVVVSEVDADEAEAASVSEEAAASDEAVIMEDGGASSEGEDTASESVGTEEASGVSDEETAADTTADAESAAEDSSDDSGISIVSIEDVDDPGIAEVSDTSASGFTITSDTWDSQWVDYGTVETLQVDVESEDELTYTWYKNDDVMKEETGSSIAVTVTEYVYYMCEVYDAAAGQYGYAYFYRYIESGIGFSYTSTVEVECGDTATLSVTALLNDMDVSDELTWQWYEYDDSSYDYNEIEDAATNTYTTEPIEEYTQYYVLATDTYGNKNSIWFSVYVASGLSHESEWKTVYVDYEDTTVLSAEQTVNEGVTLTYSWNSSASLSEDVTTSTLTTDAITSYRQYTCTVTDSYGGTRYIYFNVYVNTGLAYGEDEESYSYYTVAPDNDGVTLSVAPTVDFEGCTLSYSWEKYTEESGEWERISNDSATLATGTVETKTTYYCYVSDGYGSTIYYYFYVSIETDLKSSRSDFDYYVAVGESYTLNAEKYVSSSGTLTYQWYKDWNTISGATDGTYEITSVDSYTYYTCKVSDQYGNYIYLSYRVYVDSGLTISAVTDTYFAVAPGDSVTLSAKASVNQGEISYSWYYYNNGVWNYFSSGDYTVSEDGTSSLTVENIQKTGAYYCRVSDDYGNTTECSFRVKIDTGLSCDSGNTLYVYVPYGETTVLSLDSFSYSVYEEYENQLTFEWDKDWETIEDETGKALTTDPVTSSNIYYHCTVSDLYGDSITFYFHVFVDTGLTGDGVRNSYYVAPDTEDMVLSAADVLEANDITLSDSIDYSYQWSVQVYDETDDYWYMQDISGATADAYTIGQVTENCFYRCTVSDSYGGYMSLDFSISIENNLNVWADPSSVTVDLGDDVTLSVSATATKMDGMTYTWSYWDDEGNEIVVGTESSVTLENVQESIDYYCVVKDAYGNNCGIYVSVSVNTGLTCTDDSGWHYFYISLGEEVTLTANAAANDGVELTYQWYNDWKIIDGATSFVYDLGSVEKYGYYICRVSDGYGNSLNLYYEVCIENNLSVTAADYEVLVEYGGEATLSVTATADVMDGLTYTWYYYDENGDYCVANTDGSSLKVSNITSSKYYYCRVEDVYGNSSTVSIRVKIDTGLDYDDPDNEDEGYYSYGVALGDPLTLEAKATANDGVELTYEWYCDDGDTLIEDASSESLIIDSVTGRDYYECRVSDDYGNYLWFYFNIYVDNNLTVTVEHSYITVAPEDSVTLSFTVSANDASDLTYRWYWWDEDDNYYSETTTEPALTLDSVISSHSYECCVTDQYDNYKYAYFYVNVDNGLTVDYTYRHYVVSGGTVTLDVDASVAKGGLAYRWYFYDEDEDEDNQLDENGSSLTLSEVTESGYYHCCVSDDYGNSINVEFYVSIVTELTVSVNETYSSVILGESVDLTLKAVSPYEITWQWYRYDEDESAYVAIEGETNATLTVTPDTVGTFEYVCEVSDGVNSERWSFEVNVYSLSLSYEYYLEVEPGETGTLSVAAETVIDGATISYSWYQYNYLNGSYEAIAGVSGSSLEVSEGGQYRCSVTDGSNTRYASFYVDMNTGLSLSYENEVSVEPGSAGTLTMSASADESYSDFTFTWLQVTYDDDDNTLYTQISTEAGVDTSCVTVSEAGDYVCVVTNGYETQRIWYYVSIDSGLSVTADSRGLLIEQGSTANLSVTATTDYGTLSYLWYKWDDDWENTITLGTSASLTLTDLSLGTYYYYCIVSDAYNSYSLTFCVSVVSEIGETAATAEDAVELAFGSSQMATIASAGDYMYFKVTPETNGTYTFYSNTSVDTYGYLYDSDMNYLTDNDDGGEDANFKITYDLTAGSTYYLAVRYYSSNYIGMFRVYAVEGSEIVAVCEHENATYVSAVAATCTTAGHIGYWYCEDCDTYFSDSALTEEVSEEKLVIAATGHIWDDGEVTTAATCTTAGQKLYTCTVCGATKTEEITATGHSLTHVEAKEPTCTETGNTEYYYCADCGTYFTDADATVQTTLANVTIAATGHTWTWETTTNATCTEDGLMKQVCSVCNAESGTTQTIAATGHDFSGELHTEEATEYANGRTYYVCQNGCGETQTVSVIASTSATTTMSSVSDTLSNYTAQTEKSEGETETERVYAESEVEEINSAAQELIELDNETILATSTDDTNAMDTVSGIESLVVSANDSISETVTNNTIETEEGEDADSIVTVDSVEGAALTVLDETKTGDVDVDTENGESLSAQISVSKSTTDYSDIAEDTYAVDISMSIVKTTVTSEGTTTTETVKEDVEPSTPLRITLTIPSKYSGKSVGVIHITSDGNVEVDVTVENATQISIVVTSLSDYVIYVKECKSHTSADLVLVEAKDATCTEDGNTAYYKCSYCGKYFSDADGTEEITDKTSVVIPASHTLQLVEAKDATCTEKGNIAYYECSVCGKYFSDADGTTEITLEDTVVSKKDHTYTSEVTKEPNCTETGVRTYTCTECNETYTEEIAATGHSYSSEITKQPTCTEPGVRTYTCSKCDNTYTETIDVDADAHLAESVEHEKALEATCTAAGNIEYWYCKDCGKYYSDEALTTEITESETKISAKGHSWNSGEVTKAATCTATGTKTYTCTDCGTTKPETIAATGHKSVSHTTAKAATCTSDGNIEYWYCSTCKTYFSDKALTKVVTASNITVKATGHSVTHVAAKAATCTSDGNIEYWYCSTCKTYFSDKALTKKITVSSITVKATGHSYGEWTTTTEATALAEGTMTRTCSKCGAKETKSIAKLTPTIKVNATSIKLKKKQSTTALKVTGLASGDAVKSWKSSNTKIVTVTSKGKITAKSKTGSAYITITLKSGLTKKIKVTVQSSTVKTTKITVSSKKVSLKKGKTYTIKPTISPITSGQKVTYSSSNKKVATVNSSGKITAKKKGTATITVKSGSKSVKIKVTVK